MYSVKKEHAVVSVRGSC